MSKQSLSRPQAASTTPSDLSKIEKQFILVKWADRACLIEKPDSLCDLLAKIRDTSFYIGDECGIAVEMPLPWDPERTAELDSSAWCLVQARSELTICHILGQPQGKAFATVQPPAKPGKPGSYTYTYRSKAEAAEVWLEGVAAAGNEPPSSQGMANYRPRENLKESKQAAKDPNITPSWRASVDLGAAHIEKERGAPASGRKAVLQSEQTKAPTNYNADTGVYSVANSPIVARRDLSSWGHQTDPPFLSGRVRVCPSESFIQHENWTALTQENNTGSMDSEHIRTGACRKWGVPRQIDDGWGRWDDSNGGAEACAHAPKARLSRLHDMANRNNELVGRNDWPCPWGRAKPKPPAAPPVSSTASTAKSWGQPEAQDFIGSNHPLEDAEEFADAPIKMNESLAKNEKAPPADGWPPRAVSRVEEDVCIECASRDAAAHPAMANIKKTVRGRPIRELTLFIKGPRGGHVWRTMKDCFYIADIIRSLPEKWRIKTAKEVYVTQGDDLEILDPDRRLWDYGLPDKAVLVVEFKRDTGGEVR